VAVPLGERDRWPVVGCQPGLAGLGADARQRRSGVKVERPQRSEDVRP
jgi:hypothetical protein